MVYIEEEKDEAKVEKNKEEEWVENEKLEKEESKKKKREEKKKKTQEGKEKMKIILIQHLPYPYAPYKKDNARYYARIMDIFSHF